MSTALRRISRPRSSSPVVVVTAGAADRSARATTAAPHYLGAAGWPTHGQAAYALGTDGPQSSPRQRPAPIASLAKVMTAYLVLQRDPLTRSATGSR